MFILSITLTIKVLLSKTCDLNANSTSQMWRVTGLHYVLDFILSVEEVPGLEPRHHVLGDYWEFSRLLPYQLGLNFQICASEGTRTPTPGGHDILSVTRLPFRHRRKRVRLSEQPPHLPQVGVTRLNTLAVLP